MTAVVLPAKPVHPADDPQLKDSWERLMDAIFNCAWAVAEREQPATPTARPRPAAAGAVR